MHQSLGEIFCPPPRLSHDSRGIDSFPNSVLLPLQRWRRRHAKVMSRRRRKQRVMNLHSSEYGVYSELMLFYKSFHNNYQTCAAVCRSPASISQVCACAWRHLLPSGDASCLWTAGAAASLVSLKRHVCPGGWRCCLFLPSFLSFSLSFSILAFFPQKQQRRPESVKCPKTLKLVIIFFFNRAERKSVPLFSLCGRKGSNQGLIFQASGAVIGSTGFLCRVIRRVRVCVRACVIYIFI